MTERQVVRSWVVLGTKYPVVRTDEISVEREGEFESHGEIRISMDIPPHRFWEVESHELGHVVAGALSMKVTLQDLCGLSADLAHKVEEEWLSKFLPVYLDTLERNGRLTPPKPPTGDEPS